MGRFTDRCGNCAFSRPASVEGKVECICGGRVSEPMSPSHSPCICYRPNVKEAKRRNPQAFADTKRKKVKIEPYVPFTEEMDKQLRELFDDNLVTLADIAKRMGLKKRDITNRVCELGLSRKTIKFAASKARTAIKDGNGLPKSEQMYPHLKCCKGMCCKYKEQCAHYAHWLEMGKPQFDTIRSVSACINSYYGGMNRSESQQTYQQFISLDLKSKTPEYLTFAETC